MSFSCYVLVFAFKRANCGKINVMEKFSKRNNRKRRIREPDNDDVAHNSPDNDSRNDDRKKGTFWCIYVSSVWSIEPSSSPTPHSMCKLSIFQFSVPDNGVQKMLDASGFCAT